jgi:hypothetical protein
LFRAFDQVAATKGFGKIRGLTTGVEAVMTKQLNTNHFQVKFYKYEIYKWGSL